MFLFTTLYTYIVDTGPHIPKEMFLYRELHFCLAELVPGMAYGYYYNQQFKQKLSILLVDYVF